MREWVARVRGLLARPEATLLGAALLALSAIYLFVKIADHLGEARLGALDRWLLVLVRREVVRSSDSWIAEVAWNLTALGSYPVLTVLLLAVAGFLLVRGTPYQALYTVGTAASGALLSVGLKGLFTRARPTVVAPLVHADGWSFPSGHAMSSAVVYLTLGALLAANVSARRIKLYLLSVALGLTGLVGVSRVMLGVHYPSDVLGGWMAGLSWALGCWLISTLLRRDAGNARS